jgi:hypothetical protein
LQRKTSSNYKKQEMAVNENVQMELNS